MSAQKPAPEMASRGASRPRLLASSPPDTHAPATSPCRVGTRPAGMRWRKIGHRAHETSRQAKKSPSSPFLRVIYNYSPSLVEYSQHHGEHPPKFSSCSKP